jgi:hypothetical protein
MKSLVDVCTKRPPDLLTRQLASEKEKPLRFIVVPLG